MSRKKKQNSEEIQELQLTSMIDVVFQLLVFFLCATKFPDPEALLKSWLPRNQGLRASQPTQLELEDARLVLRADGKDKITCQRPDLQSPTGFRPFTQMVTNDLFTNQKESIPNWNQVEGYLVGAKKNFSEVGEGTKGLPVIIDFDKHVKFKYVSKVLDICAKLNITNIQIAAPELKKFTEEMGG